MRSRYFICQNQYRLSRINKPPEFPTNFLLPPTGCERRPGTSFESRRAREYALHLHRLKGCQRREVAGMRELSHAKRAGTKIITISYFYPTSRVAHFQGRRPRRDASSRKGYSFRRFIIFKMQNRDESAFTMACGSSVQFHGYDKRRLRYNNQPS